MKTISKLIFRALGLRLMGCLLAMAVFFGSAPARALVIVPTFDSTITSDANAATIESTINTAIQFYEARFADPITVTIEFKEITTAGFYGTSSWWYYNIDYSEYQADLQADATTTNDTIALSNLPAALSNPVTGTYYINVKTANLRAIGITGLNSGISGGYDGVIGLHTSELNLSRASINPAKGDLLATVEHEMDEVLGLGSSLDEGYGDPFPQDLFRYDSSGNRNFTTSGDNAYFLLSGTNFLDRFNQISGYDYGDWWVNGTRVAQVQDAFAINGTTPNPKVELVALDVIGYNLLPVPQPAIAGLNLSGTQLVLHATNGLASASYYVLTSTNLAMPVSQWTAVATNMLGTNGNFTITVPNAVSRGEPKRFFTLQLQL